MLLIVLVRRIVYLIDVRRCVQIEKNIHISNVEQFEEMVWKRLGLEHSYDF